MAFLGKVNKIVYGGDYNPEQWPEDIWEQDMQLLKQAGVDIVTLNVFNWAMLQPEEETYDFTMVDKIVKRVTEAGLYICMATSTGAHPAWMAKRYPDILRTDFSGRKRKFGGRHNSCPNSPTFQTYSVRLSEKLAKHYRDQKNILVWHVGNEYGGACYCENCEKAFRVWLKRKYGTLENLNEQWYTHFWGHTFYDWDEIPAPNLLSEHFEETRSMHQGITLDYMRFNSDSMLSNFQAEYQAVKSQIPDAVITTNLMGLYKPLDYKKWAGKMDIVSWDNYPEADAHPAYTAMNHDLMRGIRQGKPFMLMEQTPSVSNWLTHNSLKRPGVMRLQSYQAVAHGADTVMFFQMRRSRAGCEKFHGAFIDHVGTGETRVFRECAELGRELCRLGDAVLDSVSEAKAAILFDWETWWALECSAGPSTGLKYTDEIYCYYQALFELNIPVDLIGQADDFSKYSLILAPLFYMVREEVDQKIEEYILAGGQILFTYLSGYVNENDCIMTGGYPGRLRKAAGIWAEEIDALPEQKQNSFLYQGKRYPAVLLCDLIHPEGARVISSYEKDFYAGMPALTEHQFGKGKVYYMATRSSEEFYRDFLEDLCEKCGIEGLALEKEAGYLGIETAVRSKDGCRLVFFLNHSEQEREIKAPFAGMELLSLRHVKPEEKWRLPEKGVLIFREEKSKEPNLSFR